MQKDRKKITDIIVDNTVGPFDVRDNSDDSGFHYEVFFTSEPDFESCFKIFQSSNIKSRIICFVVDEEYLNLFVRK